MLGPLKIALSSDVIVPFLKNGAPLESCYDKFFPNVNSLEMFALIGRVGT